jgi:3-methyladenine DNA glycosylase AlkD
MAMHKSTPDSVARTIRGELKAGADLERSKSVQRFFKEEVRSYGWRTGDVRRATVQWRREILKQFNLEFLVQVADKLFMGEINEEKHAAVFLLQNITAKLGDDKFVLLESWLARVSTWADHDALVHYLIAPMVAAKPIRAKSVFRWAKSQNRWHRRAASVALIQGTRQRLFFYEITKLSDQLLSDQDDMVQKGLGWLLRETAKVAPTQTIPYFMRIRTRAPRLVLRTACETLPPATKKRILA